MDPLTTSLKGRIKSVYLKNFVTYNECTFYAKETLNIITGANGTGKSTVIAGIILGLGGEPGILGRSYSISDFILSDKTSCLIIIQLCGKEPMSTTSFHRSIDTTGASKFKINEEIVTRKKFLAVVDSFHIQVGNLCQFLPQDRVQDFTKMNAQELLLNTITSVSDDDLVCKFETMKVLRKQELCFRNDRNKEIVNLERDQKKLEQLQLTVNQYHERSEVIKKINIYKANKLWREVENVKNSVRQLSENKIKDTDDLNSLKRHYKNLEFAHKDSLRYMNELQEETKKKTREFFLEMETERSLDSQLESLKQELQSRKVHYKKQVERSIQSSKEMRNLEVLYQTKNNELEQNKKMKPSIDIESEKLKEKITKTRDEAMEIYSKRQEYEKKLNDEQNPEISNLNSKIEAFKNIKNKKMEVIGRKKPELIKAMNWIEQHQNEFKSKIYNPMVLELTTKNAESAKYLESVVNNRDLYAFACEDKADMSSLITELCVKLKLGVNVIICDPAEACKFKPNESIDKLKKYGFYAYLVDMVSGPAPLINKLCSMYNIHNIPIGGSEVGNYTENVPKHIRHYYGGEKRFVVTGSKYHSGSMLSENHILSANLFIVADEKYLNALTKRISEISSERNKTKNSLLGIDTHLDSLRLIQNETKDKLRILEQKRSYFVNLESDVQSFKKKLEIAKLNFIDTETLKSEFKSNAASDINKIMHVQKKQTQIIGKLHDLYCEKQFSNAKEIIFKAETQNNTNPLKECEGKILQFSESLRRTEHLINTQTNQIREKLNSIKLFCDGAIPTDDNFPYKTDFEELCDADLSNISEAIHENEARLECMRNVDTKAVEDYQEMEAKIEAQKELIENNEVQNKSLETQIGDIYKEWEPKLAQLVETISTKFSEFMESMGYVGDVVLTKKDKFDFDSYGIQVMVQYRKDAALQALDKFVQSGGERAVAIAVYSLALQHVTNVPFRCVDEINQGMDPKNERQIYELLVREATKPGSAQYFFVTPKLLGNLECNEKMSFSIVYNSGTVGNDVRFPEK